MDFAEFISKLTFNSEAIAPILVCIMGIWYWLWIKPNDAELKNYRESLSEKVKGIPTIQEIETAIRTESEVIVQSLITHYQVDVDALRNNEVEVRSLLVSINIALDQLGRYISEQDPKNEILVTEIESVTRCLDILHKMISALITQLETQKIIEPIDRSYLITDKGGPVTQDDLNNLGQLLGKLLNKQDNKITKVLQRR